MIKPRDHLLGLMPYQLPEEPEIDPAQIVRLDQNENNLNASEAVLNAAREACSESAFYPDPYASGLREAIAGVHGLRMEQIVCGRGSMELISLLATAYFDFVTSAVVSQYGYMYFRTAIAAAGAQILTAPEPNLVVDVDSVVSTIRDNTRIVFIANPGNPTGSCLSSTKIRQLREGLPENVLLVIDEAYAEYLDGDIRYRNFDLVDRGDTVVLRTFSKIYGLAGLRIGWGYFPQDVANILHTIQQPNGITGPGLAAAYVAICDREHMLRVRTRTISIRDQFVDSLKAMGLAPYPAYGNFVLVKFDSCGTASDALAHLRSDSILVRPMDGYDLDDCLRITIGTEDQIQRTTESLGRWCSKK